MEHTFSDVFILITTLFTLTIIYCMMIFFLKLLMLVINYDYCLVR
jgi:hypothetical protein